MGKKLTIKVLVDVTVDFVVGPFGSQAALDAIPAMAAFLNNHHEDGEDIIAIATRDNHGTNYKACAENIRYKAVHGIVGTDGFEFYGPIKIIVDKHVDYPRFSVIEKQSTMPYGKAEDFIAAMKKAELYEGHEEGKDVVFIVGGLVTDICAMLTAVYLQGAFPWATVMFDASAAVGCTPELHNKALDVMESMGIEVINRN